MNYKVIRHILAWVLRIEALCMLLPLICAAVYREINEVCIFSACIIAAFGMGLLLSVGTPKNKSIYAREGFVTVAASWILLSLVGALPFRISGYIPNYIDAVFETVSGFTTTGASILTDVEALPKSLIFWRSFTHWIGGMGVLVFLVALLPLSGSNNFFLVKAESPGPKVSKLVPNIKVSAKILYEIYIVMTLVEMLLLILGGMNVFDAITLSFGTAGTGGFAIKNSGLADYTSYQQIVITVFMILFGVDFSLYYLILIRKFKLALQSDELRCYLGIIIASIIAISINCFDIFGNVFDSVKHSAFQVASIITTTGYSTCDFNLWPSFSKTILVLLMFVGACAGSTGGGIKVSRIIILFKTIVKEIRIGAHPKTMFKVKMNGHVIEHETIRTVNVYMAAYLMIFAGSLLVISLDGFDFTTNFTAVASAINNIGPGLSKVGPMSNFSCYSQLSTVVLSLDMLIGRLEIFPILILLAPHTWRK